MLHGVMTNQWKIWATVAFYIYITLSEELDMRIFDTGHMMWKDKFISAKVNNNCFTCTKHFLSKTRHQEPRILFFFLTKKTFNQDQKVNKRLCRDSKDIPIVRCTKFPAAVMVLGVMSSEGDVMPPQFFPQGLRINAADYKKVVERIVELWIENMSKIKLYTYQQDCTVS